MITQDTTLDSDLLDCPGDGVVIGASGITFDLGGHTISGPGANAGTHGVDNSDGYDGVTVTNGSITEFFAAVHFARADDGTLSRLDVVRTQLSLSDSDRNLIERNDVRGSIFTSGDSDDNVIARNDVRDGGNGIFLSAIVQQVPDRNRIEDNVVTGNVFGIVATGALATTVAGNRITHHVSTGIANRSHGTLIERNYVARNGFGNQFEDPSSGITSFNAFDATVRDNHVVRNAVDGISIGASARGRNLVEGNLTQRNGDDGIDIDQANFFQGSATVTRNKAHHNGDFGIEAVPQATDGGGDKAHGNGNPAQCLNVRCK